MMDADTHRVYIDSDDLIWDAMLNQSNADANNNKFYIVQILRNEKSTQFVTWTRWGRVGDRGQSAEVYAGPSVENAIIAFEKKFKDKSGLKWADRLMDGRSGKYVFLQRSYENKAPVKGKEPAGSDEPKVEKPVPESRLLPPVQELIEFIFDQQHMKDAMAAMHYDANRLPLGALHESTLKQGFETLKVGSSGSLDYLTVASKSRISSQKEAFSQE
jgi:poly [ADP-ribose] polymerase